jgi:hypothetical protein
MNEPTARIAALLLLASLPMAAAPSYAAHRHGVAKLTLAVEGQVLEARLEAPTDAIFGFEREPRTEEERRKIADSLSSIQAGWPTWVTLPVDFGCAWQQLRLEVVREGAHAEVVGAWRAECRQDPTGQVVAFDFAALPALRTIEVEIVGPGGQQGLKIRGTGRSGPL